RVSLIRRSRKGDGHSLAGREYHVLCLGYRASIRTGPCGPDGVAVLTVRIQRRSAERLRRGDGADTVPIDPDFRASGRADRHPAARVGVTRHGTIVLARIRTVRVRVTVVWDISIRVVAVVGIRIAVP